MIVKSRTDNNKKANSVCTNSNTNVFEYYTPSFIRNKRFLKMKGMKRRAISDVIATLMLLAITVAGAVLVSAFFQGTNVFRPDASNPGTQTASLKIIGYDTRDGLDLSGISSLDNTFDGTLDSGMEFIVLNVENQGISNAVLQGLELNGIDHSWYQSTGDLTPTDIPAGEFSIIHTSGIALLTTNELQRNNEVRLVIKLSSSISPEINLNEPIRIKFTTNLIDNSETLITSGGVR